ncbi:heme oxygenase-like protein [Motilibacter rhizosphaerae]|uniref:Heme oxygenase-like protein n=1 Tax=Motilibacter rhizosphaerae TaxID=598652 RepID=A0A4Q7NAZ2_9ACTN|nr:iron-containing redox enzyme family protein [Motilibacter rhizosphaerae]RZS80013.1 heme oxygenase-like protein [Motilibacter rhizosphaerae]
MKTPRPRGPLSEAVLRELHGGTLSEATLGCARARAAETRDALTDEDVQVALLALYELHYTGIDGVPDEAEQEPSVLAVRRALEAAVERDLRRLVARTPFAAVLAEDDGEDVDLALERVIAADDGPSLSRYLSRHGDLAQWQEFLRHKSLYHLKEADPHTWVVPRIRGRAKAALVEIQADEYGGGSAVRLHSAMFGRMMRELGLDDTYGAYADDASAEALCAANLMSFFGIARRWRASALGHLAGIEMTSTEPCRRLAAGLRRLRLPESATLYYDEHVEADAVHEQLASKDMCGSLVAAEPELRADLLFGTAAYLAVEGMFGESLLREWGALAEAAAA